MGDIFSINEEHKRVAETTLPDGTWISTVRLPFELVGGWYETMVFEQQGSGEDLDMARWQTEEEAVAGHQAMIGKWTRKRHGSPTDPT